MANISRNRGGASSSSTFERDGSRVHDTRREGELGQVERVGNRSRRTIALLLVHGMGDQEPGETTEKLISGLRSVYGDDLVVERDENCEAVELHPFGDHVRLESDRRDEKDQKDEQVALQVQGIPTRVRLFEVYWADILRATEKWSFPYRRVGPLTWYPLLNWWRRRYRPRDRRIVRVAFWSLVLIPFSVLFWFGYGGLQVLQRLWNQFTGFPKQRTGDVRSWIDRKLDASVGDVFTYLASLRGAMAVNSNSYGAADKVLQLFRSTLREAASDPDVEEVHVLAHSLGTVVAYHGLTGQQSETTATSDPAPVDKVEHLITIGSPLRKILFFWPELVAERFATPSPPEWSNFNNAFDLVSGRLRGLAGHRVHDRWVWAGGAVRSHTIYESNRVFLGTMTDVLFGKPKRTPFRVWQSLLHVLLSFLETAALPAIVLFLVFIGFILIGGSMKVLVMLIAYLGEQAGAASVVTWLDAWGVGTVLTLFMILLIWRDRKTAVRLCDPSASAFVSDELIDDFLKAPTSCIESGYAVNDAERVKATLPRRGKATYSFDVRCVGREGQLNLDVQRMPAGYLFTYRSVDQIADQVRRSLRTAWTELAKQEPTSNHPG